jgi:hypothetical protein
LKRMNHPQWRFGRGPWRGDDVATMRAWAETTLAPDPAAGEQQQLGRGDGSLNKAKLLVTIERAKTLKQDREIKGKLFHRIAECDARNARKVIAVRDALLALSAAAPFDEPVREWLRRQMTAICESFARAD